MRIFVFLLFSAVVLPQLAIVRAADTAPVIEVVSAGKNRLSLKIKQNVSGDHGWRQRVDIVVPRGESVVPATKIISYCSAIEFNNGDSSYLSSPPRIGFLLFGSDQQGATVEIRLVELFDKREFVASSINGVYHFTYPGD